MFKVARYVGLILSLPLMGAMAQPGAEPPVLPQQLDLETAIALANQHNPRINEARERIREQSGVLIASQSSRRPDFNAFGQYQVEEDKRTGSFGGPTAPDEEYWRYGIGVTQPIYYGGVLNASIRSRRFELKAREYQLLSVQDRVIADVHRKFYDALLAREVIVVRKESMELLDKQLRLSKNRFEAGAGAKFDVLQAEVRVSNARPPLIRAQRICRGDRRLADLTWRSLCRRHVAHRHCAKRNAVHPARSGSTSGGHRHGGNQSPRDAGCNHATRGRPGMGGPQQEPAFATNQLLRRLRRRK